MALSNNLISQFVKVTKDTEQTENESIAYGKIVKQGDIEYVQLDGSDLLTPISSTTVVKDGDRVIVTIKNHTAIVTGDLTSPSANNEDVVEIGNKISDFEIVIADKVTTEQLEAEIARIEKLRTDELEATNAKIETLNGKVAKIDTIETDIIEVNKKITAHEGEFTTIRGEIADFENLTTEKIDAIDGNFHTLESDYADFKVTTTNKITAHEGNFGAINADIANFKDLTTDKIDAVEGNFNELNADYANFKETTTNKFTANEASINELETNKLNAETAKVTYAYIDFSNIKEAAIEKLFTDSGIIKDLVMSEGKVTGELIGVTIKGDLIEGNTVKADKLVILGTDGLYYKLNVNALGETTASSDPKYQNGLDGSVIVAKSITAEKVSVTDLVAFGATIGGFNITNNAIYSGAKGTIDNTLAGIYQDKEGQFAIGDDINFVKFYKDQNGEYRLDISADNISFGSNKKTIESLYESVTNNTEDLTNYIETTNKELTNLQGQIDGSIMTWFYEYEPTNNNIPASDWNTTALKNNHLGDLFYDTITGYCYRWQVQNNEYSWQRITDVDVTKALSDAKNAQDTADNKRRVFVNTPTTPYDVGDLWVQGVNGDIMRCQTAKTKDQSYATTDWIKASKYTDDTAVNDIENNLTTNYYTKTETDAKIEVESDRITSTVSKVETVEKAVSTAQITANNAQITANNAQTAANNAQEDIDDLEIGGRNLVLNSQWISTEESTNYLWGKIAQDVPVMYGETYTLSAYRNDVRMTDNTYGYAYAYDYKSDGTQIGTVDYMTTITGSSTKTIDNEEIAYLKIYIGVRNCVVGDVYKVKLEVGNKATDWTPAPEDVDSTIANVGNNIETRLDEINISVQSAQSTIDQLSNMISHLVTDANGESLMTQTTDGWTFNMSSINDNLNAIKDAMVDMENNHNDSDSALEKLTDLVNDIANKTAYIIMTTDEKGDPCIELGKSDNLFKVRITNQAIDFLEGSTKIAYANNNTFYSEIIIVKHNLQIGEGPGFVWRTRTNGNMGMSYVSGLNEFELNLWKTLFAIKTYDNNPVSNNNPILTFSGITGGIATNLAEEESTYESISTTVTHIAMLLNPGETLTIDIESKLTNISTYRTCLYVGNSPRSTIVLNNNYYKTLHLRTFTYTNTSTSSITINGIGAMFVPIDDTGYNAVLEIKRISISSDDSESDSVVSAVDDTLWNAFFKINSYNNTSVINNNPTLTFSGTTTNELYVNLAEKEAGYTSHYNPVPTVTVLEPGKTLSIVYTISNTNLANLYLVTRYQMGTSTRVSRSDVVNSSSNHNFTLYNDTDSDINVQGILLNFNAIDDTGYTVTMKIKTLSIW